MKTLYVPIRPIVEYLRFRDPGEAARRVAGDANKAYAEQGRRTKIEAYWGQRGWTFGVRVDVKSDGTPVFRRTKEANAVREWFRYNVLNKQQEAKRKDGIWATIESNMNKLSRIKRRLGVADAEAFSAGLERLVKKFGARSGRNFHRT